MDDSKIAFFLPTYVPTNDTSPSGGAVTTARLPGSINGLLPKAIYNTSEGADLVWFYSFFVGNTDTVDTLTGPRLWAPNLAGTFTGNGPLSAVSDSALDAGTLALLPIGWDTAGAQQTDLVPLNGVTMVMGTKTFLAPLVPKIALVDSATGLTLQYASGNISVYMNGQLIGVIPAPFGDPGYQQMFDFLTWEYAFAIESSLNTSVQAANRLTLPPSSPTFLQPTTLGTGILIPDLAPGAVQQVWVRFTGKAGLIRTTQSRVVPFVQGTD